MVFNTKNTSIPYSYLYMAINSKQGGTNLYSQFQIVTIWKNIYHLQDYKRPNYYTYLHKHVVNEYIIPYIKWLYNKIQTKLVDGEITELSYILKLLLFMNHSTEVFLLFEKGDKKLKKQIYEEITTINRPYRTYCKPDEIIKFEKEYEIEIEDINFLYKECSTDFPPDYWK